MDVRLCTKDCPVMAVRVYLGGAPAARSETAYEETDAFSVTAGGFLLIQRRQHSGAQKDLAVFAANAWLRAEVVPEPAPGLRWPVRCRARQARRQNSPMPPAGLRPIRGGRRGEPVRLVGLGPAGGGLVIGASGLHAGGQVLRRHGPASMGGRRGRLPGHRWRSRSSRRHAVYRLAAVPAT